VLIVGGNQSAAGYDIDNSCRFNDGSNDNLARTPSTTTNQKTWTWSGWVKRSKLSADNPSLIGVYSGSTQLFIAFNSSDKLPFCGFIPPLHLKLLKASCRSRILKFHKTHLSHPGRGGRKNSLFQASAV